MTSGSGPKPTRYGHPREARLRKRREFLAVQRKGVRRFTRHFIVFIAPGKTTLTRLGVTASKRTGNAVVRNCWKRRIREAFRHVRPSIRKPIDSVVIARAGLDVPNFIDARNELAHVLQDFKQGNSYGSKDRKPQRNNRRNDRND